MNQPMRPQQPPYRPQPPYPPQGYQQQGYRQGPPAGGYGPPPMGPPPMGPPPMGPPPPYGAPPPFPPPPPAKKGSAGKVVAIVAGVLVLLLLAGGFAVWKLASGVANSAGGLAGGASADCKAVGTDDVNAVLGGKWDLVQLGGLEGIAGGVLDSRVLPDAPSCWAVQDADGKLARIARYQGGDAAQRFTDEKKKAKGATVDKGNGLSVTSDSYLGKDATAGDEAFCTTGDMTASAGALVRRGDTLVYVSTTAGGQGASAVPDINLDGSSTNHISFGTDQANCDLAVKLIAKVH